jgi:hypothetical protein
MNGLLQISNAACPQGLRAYGRVIKARHEYDGKGRPGNFEPLPQINSGKSTKMNIQKKAIDLPDSVTLKKCLGGVEGPNLKAVRIQQQPDRVECA